MKNIKYLLFTLLLTITFNSCQESDLPSAEKSVINSENGIENQFDIFLRREFVTPYNIDVLYKLADIETDLNNYVVPSSYSQSIRMANLMRYLALEPFSKVVSKEFLQNYFPKQVVFVGSGAYRNNGTVLLGTAEGGLKIALYDINNLDVTDLERLNARYFRTIYHEFAHILHQNIPYTQDFVVLSATDYVQDEWNTFWPSGGVTSLEKGFISDYASNDPNEDFVELFAFYISKTPAEWDALISGAGISGGAIITQKVGIVKSYMKSSWNLDMDTLRDEILMRQSNLSSQDLDNIN